ncbi:MAG: HD domain-containing protein [Clostridiales bacterium]|nr:HD domain-containing protein [Clostridiales bacterium]
MAYKKINELREGEVADGFYLVKDISVKLGKNGSRYADLKIADKTGEIAAKIWSCDEDTAQRYPNNTIVKVRGQVRSWNNQQQMTIEKIRAATEDDKVFPRDFVSSAPRSAQEMFALLQTYASRIRNNQISLLVNEIIAEKKEKLMYYPAAKTNHHSIQGGLLYHTTTMLRMADKIMEVYDGIDSDLLYAGVILHDMEKTTELDSTELGITQDYTQPGKLLGHIILGIRTVERVGRRLGIDENIITALQHMIYTHHYEPEYGSPLKPMFKEAEVLHYLDVLDARLYDMEAVLSHVGDGAFSERVWSLHNRQLFKPEINTSLTYTVDEDK